MNKRRARFLHHRLDCLCDAPRPGVPERRSFGHVRHGTVDLFAALRTATGAVIIAWSPRHAAVDFRDFPGLIDRQVEPGLAVHVACDNLSAPRAPVVHERLLAHPRFALHFTPAYSSWIDRIERGFAEPERRRLQRGSPCSLDALKPAPEAWIDTRNDTARPFKWTRTADRIIDRVCRCRTRIPGPAHWPQVVWRKG